MCLRHKVILLLLFLCLRVSGQNGQESPSVQITLLLPKIPGLMRMLHSTKSQTHAQANAMWLNICLKVSGIRTFTQCSFPFVGTAQWNSKPKSKFAFVLFLCFSSVVAGQSFYACMRATSSTVKRFQRFARFSCELTTAFIYVAQCLYYGLLPCSFDVCAYAVI